MKLPIAYTARQIKDGTGWAKNVRFVAVPELTTSLEIEAERYILESKHQDNTEDIYYMHGAAAVLRETARLFRDRK